MFGKRLNETRKALGITAQQMADYICVTLRTYRNYECGRSYPDYEKLVLIADKLGVFTDYLLGRDDFLAKHAGEH